MGRSEREDQSAALMFGRIRLLHTADINSEAAFLKPKLFQNGSFLCCNSHEVSLNAVEGFRLRPRNRTNFDAVSSFDAVDG